MWIFRQSFSCPFHNITAQKALLTNISFLWQFYALALSNNHNNVSQASLDFAWRCGQTKPSGRLPQGDSAAAICQMVLNVLRPPRTVRRRHYLHSLLRRPRQDPCGLGGGGDWNWNIVRLGTNRSGRSRCRRSIWIYALVSSICRPNWVESETESPIFRTWWQEGFSWSGMQCRLRKGLKKSFDLNLNMTPTRFEPRRAGWWPHASTLDHWRPLN